MKAILKYLWARRTTAFGYVQVTIAVLAGSTGALSPEALKFYILVNALLTAWLGHYNNIRIKRARDSVDASETETGV